MTDTPTTPTAPATPSTTEVTSAPVGAKPYDDAIFESYTDEPVEGSEESISTSEEVESAQEEAPSEESETQENKDSEEINKATKHDKVDDGFKELPLKEIINGKEVQFKVKDAIQAYVKQEEFNRNMDRRITHVSQREKAWQSDQESFKGNLSKLMQVAQGGDFVTAVRGLAKIATHGTNLDPTEFEKQYFDQLDKVREVYTKMSPEQRDAYFAKRSLQEAKARASELEKEKSLTVQASQLQQKVQTLQQQYGIPEDEFWGGYETLSKGLVERGIKKTPDEIQPEEVVQFALETRRHEKVFTAAKMTGLTDEAMIDEVANITRSRPDLTAEDIAEVIRQGRLVPTAPNDAVENLNRKAGRSNTQFSKASSTKKESTNGYAKEDLEFLYRNQPKGYSRSVR
jgi:hypothetical protein